MAERSSLDGGLFDAVETNRKRSFSMAANKKVSAKDLPHALTKDTDVIKAMQSIQRAGFMGQHSAAASSSSGISLRYL